MLLGRCRFAALLAVLVFVAHPFARADNENLDVPYRRALELHQRAETQRKQASEIEAKTGTAESANAKAQLQKESAALRLSANESQAEARKIMEALAPRDRKGYGPAHVWLVDQLYRMEVGTDGKSVPPTPRTLLDCERHLLYALEWSDDTVKEKAHFGLARLYRDTGRIEEAKKHFTQVAARRPEYRLILAQWAKAQGENEEVVPHAKAAEHAYRAKLNRNQEDYDARLGVSECLILQGNFKEAEELIKVGMTLAIQPEVLRMYVRKAAAVNLAWFDAEEGDSKSTATERVEMLEKALKLDEENPGAFNSILKLCRDKSPQSEKVLEKYRGMVVEGRDSPTLHLILWIDAWEQKKQVEARYHLEKALKLSPKAQIIADNLKWSLAFSEPADLPGYRGVRDHILPKLGRDKETLADSDRNKEALADLEKAIKAYPNDAKLFHTLADTCEKLGYTIQAEQYRKRAKELESNEKAKNPRKP